MYLVTGASGQLGRGVIASLLAEQNIPATKIIAVTRKPEALAEMAAKGVTVRAGDFDDESGLVKAFAGAKRLLLISTDAIGVPGKRAEQHARAIAAAEKAGVEHILYTSAPNPENSPLLLAPDHEETEKAIKSSKIPGWTLLRHHWYFENLFYAVPHALKAGTWYSAAGDGKIAHMSRADFAKADAAALVNETGKKVLTISGSEARSTEEIAKAVSAATGKPLAVVKVPVEAIIQGMVGAGMPEPVAKVLASFDTNTAQGRVADVTGDYQKLTGEEPQGFDDWLKSNAKALAA